MDHPTLGPFESMIGWPVRKFHWSMDGTTRGRFESGGCGVKHASSVISG